MTAAPATTANTNAIEAEAAKFENSNPIFKKFFRHRPLLPGKVFDSPASQLFRLEHSAFTLLPQLGPFSRVAFLRRANGRGLRAECLQLSGGVGGAEVRPVDGKIGRRLCAVREAYLKKRLTNLHRVIQLFKK